MNKRILDIGSVVGLIALIAFGVFAVAGGLGGSDTKAADSAREASCLTGAEGCDDTGGDALGVCAPDTPDCVDTIVNPNSDEPINICIEGASDCNDTPPDAGDSLNQICGSNTPGCSPVPGSDGFGGTEPGSVPGILACAAAECERKAVDAALAALKSLNGTLRDAVPEPSVKLVEWPDSCLGVSTPDVACAQVITPGYIVIFDTGVLAYEFHTDLNGNAVLAEPAQ